MAVHNKKLTGEKLQNILDGLIEGINRKKIEHEEGISQTTITFIKQAHPLFFWNKDNDVE